MAASLARRVLAVTYFNQHDYYVAVCTVCSPPAARGNWRWSGSIPPPWRNAAWPQSAELMAMLAAIHVASIQQENRLEIVYDSVLNLRLVQEQEFLVDAGTCETGGAIVHWEETQLLRTIANGIARLLFRGTEVVFTHKDYTEYATIHEWPPDKACTDTFKTRMHLGNECPIILEASRPTMKQLDPVWFQVTWHETGVGCYILFYPEFQRGGWL
jgi:hypothetical protein